jgi:hypothetical protein
MSRPSHLNWSIFRGSVELRAGNLTEKDLRSRSWREIRPDVYVDSRLPLDHSIACHAAALALPDRICFSGASAAYLLGVVHAADYEDDVHVTIAPTDSVRTLARVRVRKTPLALGDKDWIEGLPVTSALRTAWDLGASRPAQDSVPVIDALLGLALLTSNELHAYAQPRLSRRGGRNAARAFELADGRARTPESSRLRLAALAAGLPPATPHHPIVFSGSVHTPELAWPEQRVGLAFLTDHARYSDEDWVVVRIDPDTVTASLPGVLRDLRSALLGRGWQGPRS